MELMYELSNICPYRRKMGKNAYECNIQATIIHTSNDMSKTTEAS